MARMAKIIGTAALGLLLTTGCVSQEKYNALKLDRDRMAEQLAQAQTEASSARSESDLLKKQLDAIANANGSKDGLASNLASLSLMSRKSQVLMVSSSWSRKSFIQ